MILNIRKTGVLNILKPPAPFYYCDSFTFKKYIFNHEVHILVRNISADFIKSAPKGLYSSMS